jgi:putative MATE family efflux protein
MKLAACGLWLVACGLWLVALILLIKTVNLPKISYPGKIIVKTSVTYRQILQIAYPIIIGSVAQNILNVTDTAFLGRVGQVALGAGAIGGVFYLVFSMLAWGFGIGIQIIIARRNGERSFTEIGRTFQHGFYFLLPLALALFSLMQFFSGDLMKHIIRSQEVLGSFNEYIRFRSYGIFFAGTNMLFRGLYIGIAKTRVITWSTVTSASVNVILDYGLIFGHFGLPEMGIGGAALASVIAEFSTLVYFVIYTFIKLDVDKFRLLKLARFDESLYKRVIRVSVPAMFQNFFSMASWLVFFLFIEKLGEQALAVSNIIRSFYIILIIPIWGFSSATSSIASNLIGQGRQGEVISFVYKVVRLCTSGVLILIILGSLFPAYALKIYTNDPTLIVASLPALYVINFAALFLAVGFIFFSAVSGTGKTNVSLVIEIIVIIIYLIIAYILADFLNMEVQYVWITECFYGVLLGTLSYIYLKKGKWKSSLI